MNNSKRVIAAVSDYWIIGSLSLPNTRIQEVLNDPRSEFLQLQDVEVHVRESSGRVAELDQTIIPKRKLQYLVADCAEHETPERRWTHHKPKDVFRAFALVGDDCLSGNLHFSSRPTDSLHAWLNQLSHFVVLTEASLCMHGRGVNSMQLPLVFFNKEHVSCFEVSVQAESDPSSYPSLQSTVQDEEGGLRGLLDDVSKMQCFSDDASLQCPTPTL